MIKKILIISLFLVSFSVYPIQFNFISGILSNKIIKNFGNYRAYGNGKYAKSCQEYKNLPIDGYQYRGDIGSGVYRLKTPTGVIVDAYCDMVTDGGGWTLVASWLNASEWTMTSTSTAAAVLTTPINAFSSNFGDYSLNYFRVTAAGTVSGSPLADFYYKWNTATTWKEVWSPSSGSNVGYMSPTPRHSLKQFNSAFNLKYGVSVTQTWNNISDWNYTTNTAGATANWWKGLTTAGEPLGVYNLDKYQAMTGDVNDGTFALMPSNTSTPDISGQDMAYNVKIGYDDTFRHMGFGGGNSTNIYSAGTYQVDAETSLWLWIK